MERALAPLTSAYVCVCESEQRAALRLPFVTPERAHCIYNGVPDPPSDSDPERALLDFKGDGLLVGAVTVLREQKRVDVLIDAIPTVLEQVPRARFAIVGNGPMRGQLEEQAGAAGLSEDPRFAFFEFTPPSGRYMSALDLYVLSSAWEAMPVGVLEALSWGVPQVVTSVGGTAEAVSAETGRLVSPKRPAALADAIVAMLRSPELRASAQQASRARHRAMFDAERMVRETVGVYETLVTAPQPATEPSIASIGVLDTTSGKASIAAGGALDMTPDTRVMLPLS